MSGGLSPALLALLHDRVDSYDKLELLIALHRAPSHRSTVRELAALLDLDRDEVRVLASQLMVSGLVELGAGGDLAIRPRTPQDDALIAELVAAYAADRITLVKTVAEASMSRLRSLAGRAFAEAFVIRKKRGGDDDR